MKTLYEANWHYSNDTLVRISVTPITVLREGILPGCSEVSITAVDSNGHEFQGCPRDFFETEEAAWEQIKVELQETIASEERDVCEAQRRIRGLRSVLSAIQGDEPAEVLQDAISVVGMPEFDALMDYIYEEGTSGEAVVPLANKLVRAAIQSHVIRARNAQPAPGVKALVKALEEGLRAIGDHHAPGDCYATGPMTGDPFRDLVQCPACSFIAMCDDLLAARRKVGDGSY